jgi:hypothetical protein
MAQVVKLNAAVVTVIKPAAQQTLNYARDGLDHRVDFVGCNAARYLVGVAAWTLNEGSRFQGKLSGRLLFNAALTALQDLLVDEPLIPLPMPPSQTSTTFCADHHQLPIIFQNPCQLNRYLKQV